MKVNRHAKIVELINKYQIETQDELAEKLKEAGFDVQVKNIAWDGIFAALASNQVDVIAASVSITDKRKKAMLFTDPYYELHQAARQGNQGSRRACRKAGRWPDRHDCHGSDHPRFQDQDDCEDLRRSGARL